MDLLINPPSKENCSESTLRKYNEEVSKNFNDLKEKALMIYEKLNKSKYKARGYKIYYIRIHKSLQHSTH